MATIRVTAIGGLATDWAPDNLGGDFKAWLDAPFAQPTMTTIMVPLDGSSPVGTGVRKNVFALPSLHVQIMDKANEATLRPQLLAALDTSESFKALVIADDDGSNERYWMVSFEAVEERDNARGSGSAFVASPVVADRRTRPRSSTESTQTATITSSGQTMVVNNTGQLDAYPVYSVRPINYRSGNDHWKYKDFCVVRWRSPNAERRYPINVVGASYDTTGLTPTKAIDGTSFGVIVDGAEVERFFGAADTSAGGFDSSSTKVWCNLDFQPALSVTIASGFGTDAIDEILVNEDISAWPNKGILYSAVTDELFIYTGTDVYRRAFTGISREAHSTSAASQSAGQALEWIQHEIFVVYTPAEDMALVPDEANRPLLDLVNSTNDVWIWDNAGDSNSGFGDTFPNGDRPAKWTPIQEGDARVFFTDQDFFAFTNPHEAAGIRNLYINNHLARWQVYLPCGIGDYEIDGDDYFESGVYSGGASRVQLSEDGESWTTQDFTDGSVSGWDAWQETASSLDSNWRYLSLANSGHNYASQMTRVEVTNHADLRPFVSRTGETLNYQMELTITNQTTGEAITLTRYPGLTLYEMDIDDTLVLQFETIRVDTDNKTVTIFPPTNQNIYQAMRRDRPRQHILRLAPGNNTLAITEANLTSVRIDVSYRRRWYS